MARREKIAPPEITEDLLSKAEQIFLEASENDRVWSALFKNGKTKKRYKAIGEALLNLRTAWAKLSDEEREWFFMSVNTPKEATKLLLGMPDNDPLYNMQKQPHEVMHKLNAACNGYKEYIKVAAYRGNRRVYRHKAVIEFLMNHWEHVTGTRAVYSRKNKIGDDKPIILVQWVEDCLKRLKDRGIRVEVAGSENRLEKVYKSREKPKHKRKALN